MALRDTFMAGVAATSGYLSVFAVPVAASDGLSVDLGARRTVLDSAAAIRRLVNVAPDLCVIFAGLSFRGNRPLTTWSVVPRDSHTEAGVTSVILLGRPLR